VACRFCDRLWEDFDRWDRAHSNERELWFADSEHSRALAEQAFDIREADPAAAFALFLEAADAGSATAMAAVAYSYHWGDPVAADFEKAHLYYVRAITAGSWIATLNYARLLNDHGYHTECDEVLEDGIACDFLPAYFWLAEVRYRRRPGRQACRDVRPLLERAAARGHPFARFRLAQMMITGKFGLREVPAGFAHLWRWAGHWANERDDYAGARSGTADVAASA
jgi:TPR repeat protein